MILPRKRILFLREGLTEERRVILSMLEENTNLYNSSQSEGADQFLQKKKVLP